VAEVEFNSGAKPVIESPAELQLLTADRAKLISGRVVAYVPQQALGFTLHSANAGLGGRSSAARAAFFKPMFTA